MRRPTIMASAVSLLAVCAGTASAAPVYNIVDIGVIPGDAVSQAFGISPGGVATGRSVGSDAQAYAWTLGGGLVGLTNLAGRNYCVGNGASDNGLVAGTGGTSLSGASPLPVLWTNGVPQQLPLPVGHNLGRAYDVNDAGLVVGSAGSGIGEVGVIYTGDGATVISTTTDTGCYMTTAHAVNNSGLVIGDGVDPADAGRNVAMAYDSNTNSMIEIGALPGNNGALAFGVSDAGHVVGGSMMNQASGNPYVWTQGGGMVAIPLVADTNHGTAYAVNSDGWVVGTDAGVFAVPFLFDGTNSYRLQDLIPSGTDWDLATNTFASAWGISEDGTIVGTGLNNGEIHAYAMVLVPAPGAAMVLPIAGLAAARRRRR